MQEIPQSLAFSAVKSVLYRTQELIFKRIMGQVQGTKPHLWQAEEKV